MARFGDNRSGWCLGASVWYKMRVDSADQIRVVGRFTAPSAGRSILRRTIPPDELAEHGAESGPVMTILRKDQQYRTTEAGRQRLRGD